MGKLGIRGRTAPQRGLGPVSATGAQGGGLARAILADPMGGFAVRAITRDAKSTAARALAERGAEVVTADVDDERSLERAFAGAHGLYAVTFYWDNLIHFGMGPKPGADGVLAFTLPMGQAKLPGIAAQDIGRCAHGIFKRPDLAGKTVGIAGEHLSGADRAQKLGMALGRPVRFNDVSPEVFRGFGFPGADDLGNMFQYKRDFEREYRAARDVAFSRTLNPALQSFDAWLAANAGRIPIGEAGPA